MHGDCSTPRLGSMILTALEASIDARIRDNSVATRGRSDHLGQHMLKLEYFCLCGLVTDG